MKKQEIHILRLEGHINEFKTKRMLDIQGFNNVGYYNNLKHCLKDICNVDINSENELKLEFHPNREKQVMNKISNINKIYLKISK